MAAAEGCRVMATFRFHLIGNNMPVELDVDAATVDDLGVLVTERRFIVGRLTQLDHDGLLPGMLIATSRIQCVVEAS